MVHGGIQYLHVIFLLILRLTCRITVGSCPRVRTSTRVCVESVYTRGSIATRIGGTVIDVIVTVVSIVTGHAIACV